MTGDNGDNKLNDVAKEELARQTIIAVVSLVGTAATVLVIRWMQHPDSYRESKMRLALLGKRFAQAQADWWQTQADRFATAYNREKA
jgi:hypothetical protein